MAFAETAQLAVQLNLSGNFRTAIPAAEQQFAGLNRTAAGIPPATGRLAGAFGTATRAASGFGGALGHAGSQLKSLAFGPLGLLGVTGSLLTLSGAIGTGIGKAQEFGKTVVRLSAVTGLTTEATSALSAAMEHFNVGADKQIRLVGFLEKNIGLLASRKDGIKNFEQTFGLALTDSTGKLKDANEQILTTADYFNNKSIPATTKAAALAKIYGRSWQDLIPFLQAGRQGIIDAEKAAADFGLTLTADNIVALKEARKATRDWGDALGGLELQVGLQLLPSLTDLAKTATSFVSQNRGQIVGFFREGQHWAGEFGKAIKDYVIPTFGLIKSGWDAIPEPIRQVILAGVIGGKVSKFLFNVGPIDIAKGIGGAFFSRGSPVNPMWVKQVGLPGSGGGGIPVPGGGGLSTLAKVALVGEAVGLVAAVEAVREAVGDRNSKIAASIQDQTKQYLAQNPSKADLENSLAAVTKGINDISANPLNVLVQGDALDRLNQMRDDIKAQLYALGQIPQAVSDAAAKAVTTDPKAAEAAKQFDAGAIRQFNDQSPAMIRAFQSGAKGLVTLISPLTGLIATLRAAKGEAEIRKAAEALAAAVKGEKGRGTLTAGTAGLGVKELRDTLIALEAKRAAAVKTGNTALATALGKDIAAVEKKLPARELVAKSLAAEEKILSSSESSKQKLSDLTRIQNDLRTHGDTHTAAKLSHDIQALRDRLARRVDAGASLTAAAIAHKKQMVSVNVQNTLSVSTTVSARQVRTAEVVVQRYGTNRIGWT